MFDPLDRCLSLVEDVFVASQQGKREFLIGIVTAKLYPVGRYADGLGVILQGTVFHLRHFTQKFCLQSQKSFKSELRFGVRHFVVPSKKCGGIGVPLVGLGK
jgi:hypothetical protein